MTFFSDKQIEELEVIFGIKRVEGVLQVRDGYVTPNDMVWWRCVDGPVQVAVRTHSGNIKENPEYYQIKRPKFTIEYLD